MVRSPGLNHMDSILMAPTLVETIHTVRTTQLGNKRIFMNKKLLETTVRKIFYNWILLVATSKNLVIITNVWFV